MQLFKHIDRINSMDKLIRQARTGVPTVLAKRLGISVSRLYVIVDQLKDMGAPIVYSRQLGTYYYQHEFSISITVHLHSLDEKKLRHVSGGEFLFQQGIATTFFVEWPKLF